MSVAPQVLSPCFSRTMARASGCARMAAQTSLDSRNPGRRYGTQTTSFPKRSWTTSCPRSLFVSPTIASAWVWITASASRKPWSSVSIDGRGEPGSWRQRAR